MKNNIYDVIVIGGGASGMMAAGRAAERGKRVLLLEKNKTLGEKLKITGGGRCNIANAEESVQLLLGHYGAAKQFLFSSFSQFGVSDTFTFFESKGLPLVIQERQRVFPKTEKAADVLKVLEQYLKQHNVEIKTNVRVNEIVGVNGKIKNIIADKKILQANSYIVATGGKSHPETGSTGDGFKWLASLGHTVTQPTPSIVPLAVDDSWVKKLAGVTLPEMKITFFLNDKKSFSLKGPLLFTHFGLSGPLILNAAKKVADLLHAGQVTATIDIHPTSDLGSFDKQIIKIFDDNKNKTLKNVFKEITPAGTAGVILSLIKNVDSETKVHSITKDQRRQIVYLLKNLPVTIKGLMGDDRAVISDGGVSLKEIDAKTMQSKLYSNLFVTGDLLHISRPSGGYSLQLCWTTGHIAGSYC
ncbi:MAG: NAD(P)/FAD-dependent oxidoreductase [Candidatus Buchananbacteria bacterium]|nr:NAD(P)/FAD-dependent oxidoreductase [Candidatus Buchananbacteria bacterium]